jgi:aminoglycoside phosphotransferase (APT) family kinase protein
MKLSIEALRALLHEQAPQYALYPLREVDLQGHDHRSYFLGEDWVVRLPSRSEYAAQIEKEARFLPELARSLSTPIPRPVFVGRPSERFPYPFSINTRLPGTRVDLLAGGSFADLVNPLAAFIQDLQAHTPSDGPPPGAHNFHRGAHIQFYAQEFFEAFKHLPRPHQNSNLVARFQTALDHPHLGPALLLHGDLEASNLLWHEGQLQVLDFGNLAVGDPACDYVIAWTSFNTNERAAFFNALKLETWTIERARAWAAWKAAITMANPNAHRHHVKAQKTLDALCEGI